VLTVTSVIVLSATKLCSPTVAGCKVLAAAAGGRSGYDKPKGFSRRKIAQPDRSGPIGFSRRGQFLTAEQGKRN
jgi:hypothetical protein